MFHDNTINTCLPCKPLIMSKVRLVSAFSRCFVRVSHLKVRQILHTTTLEIGVNNSLH